MMMRQRFLSKGSVQQPFRLGILIGDVELNDNNLDRIRISTPGESFNHHTSLSAKNSSRLYFLKTLKK